MYKDKRHLRTKVERAEIKKNYHQPLEELNLRASSTLLESATPLDASKLFSIVFHSHSDNDICWALRRILDLPVDEINWYRLDSAVRYGGVLEQALEQEGLRAMLRNKFYELDPAKREKYRFNIFGLLWKILNEPQLPATRSDKLH